MLEGVLKAIWALISCCSFSGFNPWYVGGGVKSIQGKAQENGLEVSILGMLEGVLKAAR